MECCLNTQKKIRFPLPSLCRSLSRLTTSIGNGNRYGNQGHNGYWQATVITESSDSRKNNMKTGESVVRKISTKKNRWAMKAQVGTAFPAEDGVYKMPVSVGITVETEIK